MNLWRPIHNSATLHNPGDGYVLFHRGYNLDQPYYSDMPKETYCSDVKSITTTQEWQSALRQSSSYFIDPDTRVVEALAINLLVRVVTRKKSKSQASQLSPTINDNLSQEDPFVLTDEQLIRDAKLPFGWDITYKLSILRPCMQKAGKDEKYVIDSTKTTFPKEARLIIHPPYSSDEIVAHLRQGISHRDMEHDVSHKIGTIVNFAKDQAFFLSCYKDGKTGNTLLGKDSFFCIQERANSKEVTPCHTTEAFVALSERFWNKQTSSTKASKTINLAVSFGIKAVDDEPFESKFDTWDEYLESVSEENGDITVYPNADDLNDGNIFSQDADGKKAPPVAMEHKTQAQIRTDQTANIRMLEEYIWKLQTNPESDYHNALSLEHYKATKDQWMKMKLPTGNFIWQEYTCIPNVPRSWPPLDCLPEHVRQGLGLHFCGQKPGKGKHPIEDENIMGSYKAYQKSEQELAMEEKREQQQLMEKLIGAIGQRDTSSNGIGVSSDPSIFVIRFYRPDQPQRLVDIHANTYDSNKTLETLWNHETTKEIIRHGFSSSDKKRIRDGTSYLALSHVNHLNTDQVFNRIFVKDLGTMTLSDVWNSIPHENGCIIDGAAFPIHFGVSVVDLPENEPDSDGDDGFL